jgi:hypothetical protein
VSQAARVLGVSGDGMFIVRGSTILLLIYVPMMDFHFSSTFALCCGPGAKSGAKKGLSVEIGSFSFFKTPLKLRCKTSTFSRSLGNVMKFLEGVHLGGRGESQTQWSKSR